MWGSGSGRRWGGFLGRRGWGRGSGRKREQQSSGAAEQRMSRGGQPCERPGLSRGNPCDIGLLICCCAGLLLCFLHAAVCEVEDWLRWRTLRSSCACAGGDAAAAAGAGGGVGGGDRGGAELSGGLDRVPDHGVPAGGWCAGDVCRRGALGGCVGAGGADECRGGRAGGGAGEGEVAGCGVAVSRGGE